MPTEDAHVGFVCPLVVVLLVVFVSYINTVSTFLGHHQCIVPEQPPQCTCTVDKYTVTRTRTLVAHPIRGVECLQHNT